MKEFIKQTLNRLGIGCGCFFLTPSKIITNLNDIYGWKVSFNIVREEPYKVVVEASSNGEKIYITYKFKDVSNYGGKGTNTIYRIVDDVEVDETLKKC